MLARTIRPDAGEEDQTPDGESNVEREVAECGSA
jgi:hypothetical protein